MSDVHELPHGPVQSGLRGLPPLQLEVPQLLAQIVDPTPPDARLKHDLLADLSEHVFLHTQYFALLQVHEERLHVFRVCLELFLEFLQRVLDLLLVQRILLPKLLLQKLPAVLVTLLLTRGHPPDPVQWARPLHQPLRQRMDFGHRITEYELLDRDGVAWHVPRHFLCSGLTNLLVYLGSPVTPTVQRLQEGLARVKIWNPLHRAHGRPTRPRD